MSGARLTRPGPTDNEHMVVTCTPDETSVEFFEFEDDAVDAARLNLHPSTSTYVAKVGYQGEHAVRGTRKHVAVMVEIDDELRRILSREYGAKSQKQIATALKAMLEGTCAALRGMGKFE